MKKTVFIVLIAAVMALFLLPLSSCNKYTSHYKATMLVQTHTTKNASMSFSSFEGTMVFKLKCESADEKINYSAKLENGAAKVFYDCNGTKAELFSIHSGDDITKSGGILQKSTVYIIIEMSETGQDGHFNFDIK